MSTLDALSARTASAMGPMQASAAGSRRHVGLSSPKTISLAQREAPRITASRAALRSPVSSRAGGGPQAAPYIPAA
eukprot:9991122-Lingulodinium_polyedra.AAC.1